MSCQLELCEIVKDYKTFKAVNHINLTIEKGEIVSLLGPSGCGKTTTLRMIAGLISPTSGIVKIEEKDVTGIPPYKRDVAMVFQNYALFPHLTVFENVVYGLRNRKIKDKNVLQRKASEVLAIVQLEGAENKYPCQLSGGQQQRVSLARALIVEPKVMLFDEPLSNLDAKLRVQTRVEIRNLLKQLNVTAVYVTHDQEEALTISDRIAVMHKGRIEQISTPNKLYNLPNTTFVADFIGHANLFDGVVCEQHGTVYLKLENGSVLHCGSTENVVADTERSALIRPENIFLTAQPGNADNSFYGKIIERNFLGSIVRYKIQLAFGQVLEVEVHPAQDSLPDAEMVYANFNGTNIVLLD